MQSRDPALIEFIEFLDGARLVSSVQEQKRITAEMLALQSGEKVLDIGCGTGDDLCDMAPLVAPAGRCVGVDLKEGMIEEARTRARQKRLPVEFLQADIYTLPFADQTFDVARAERVFEHLQRPVQALQEMIRVTRSGGRILVASPDMDTNLIDHPNRQITRKIQHFECDRRPNGSAGHKLYGLFWDAGLTDLQVRAVVHTTLDYKEMLSFLDIRERVEAAQKAGVITIDEAQIWLEQLAQAGQAGRYFMSTNHYVVYGRKP
ncbi:methyltransferase domain-containing protein [Ktedonosporobacter rubrisoli]|nr:methyltransferase domain-containing protein [Ktedonosporobacter rubrisoli]